MTSRSSTGRYAFDRFRLTSDGTLLCRGDEVVPLAPKVLQTLLVLVQRAGDVVTKDALLRAVWPDCFVEETGLTRNVSLLQGARTFELRAALLLCRLNAVKGAVAVRRVLEHFPEPAPWPEILAARQTLAAPAAK